VLVPADIADGEKKQGNDHFYMDAHLMFVKFVDEAGCQLTDPAARSLGYELALKGNFFQIMIYKCVAEKYQFKYLASGGKLIFPLPEIEIV
jgi:hypothetical protein